MAFPVCFGEVFGGEVSGDRPQGRGRERAKRAPKLVLGTLKNIEEQMDINQNSLSISLLDTFMDWPGDDAPSKDYVLGFAHALLNCGLIDSQKWAAVTDWAAKRS